jgi:hypothetical protein
MSAPLRLRRVRKHPAWIVSAAMGVVVAAIFVFLWRAQGHAVAYGDVPTWLAVTAAAFGAIVALRQLREQQKDIARQASQLERRQADHIDVAWLTGWMYGPNAETPELTSAPGDIPFMADVRNRSRRPIRRVACRADNGVDRTLIPAGTVGQLLVTSPNSGPVFIDSVHSPYVPLIRAGDRYAFAFPLGQSQNPECRFILRFTDDAGLHWQVDHELHLEKLARRDW